MGYDGGDKVGMAHGSDGASTTFTSPPSFEKGALGYWEGGRMGETALVGGETVLQLIVTVERQGEEGGVYPHICFNGAASALLE